MLYLFQTWEEFHEIVLHFCFITYENLIDWKKYVNRKKLYNYRTLCEYYQCDLYLWFINHIV